MSLKKKAAQIDLGMLVAGAVANSGQSANPLNQAPTSGMTAIGMHAETVYKDRKISAENEALKAELAEWSGASPAQKLDPKLVKPSKWANRDEGSFRGTAWESFRDEISSAGGNVQPIKVRGVRPANTPSLVYEIVFGHRRHRACLELGLPVLAMVADTTDKELFEQMDRENRHRTDLTIYEQGEMYRQALDEGLYPSVRKLSERLGVGLGNASECVAIARLPAQVLNGFESRLDIQRRWAGPLAAAVQKDPDHVLAVAAAVEAERVAGRVVKSGEVFKRLTTIHEDIPSGSVVVAKSVSVQGGGDKAGKIGFNAKKRIFEITLSGLAPSEMKAVESAIKALIA